MIVIFKGNKYYAFSVYIYIYSQVSYRYIYTYNICMVEILWTYVMAHYCTSLLWVEICPLKYILKFQHKKPVNVTIFGNKCFLSVIKLR